MSAAEQFNERIKSTFEKLEVIKNQLQKFQIEQRSQPKNWGFSGSAGYVNEQLDNIIHFLGSK